MKINLKEIDLISEIKSIFIKKYEDEKSLDQNKLKEVIEILKPDSFCLILDNLTTGYFHQSIRVEIFNKYIYFKNSPDSIFYRKKINNIYIDFNKSFDELDWFLALNFSLNPNNGNPIYEINKEYDDNIGRQKVIDDIQPIINITKTNYVKLISISRAPYIDKREITITLFTIMVIVILLKFLP